MFITLQSTVGPFLCASTAVVGALLVIVQRRWKRRKFERMVESCFLAEESSADDEFTVTSEDADGLDANSAVGDESEASEEVEDEYDSANDSPYSTDDDDGNGNESEEIDSGADY